MLRYCLTHERGWYPGGSQTGRAARWPDSRTPGWQPLRWPMVIGALILAYDADCSAQIVIETTPCDWCRAEENERLCMIL